MSPSWNLKLGTWEEPCSIKEWNKMEVLMTIPRKKPCLQKQNKTKWLIRTAAIYICRGLNVTDQRIIIFPFSLALTLWIAIPCISLSEKKMIYVPGPWSLQTNPRTWLQNKLSSVPFKVKAVELFVWLFVYFCNNRYTKKDPLESHLWCQERKKSMIQYGDSGLKNCLV